MVPKPYRIFIQISTTTAQRTLHHLSSFNNSSFFFFAFFHHKKKRKKSATFYGLRVLLTTKVFIAITIHEYCSSWVIVHYRHYLIPVIVHRYSSTRCTVHQTNLDSGTYLCLEFYVIERLKLLRHKSVYHSPV